LVPIVQQAWILAQRYEAVVANPPYMGSKGMNKALKDYAKSAYPNSKSDLFAIFMEHGFSLLNENAFNAMVTMQSWMFLSSYEKMREALLENSTIETMVHMGNGVMKIAFGTNATVFRNHHIAGMKGSFSYAEAGDISENGEPFEFPVRNERLKVMAPDDFKKIPGSPLAYWLEDKMLESFKNNNIASELTLKQGLATGDNERFLRCWWEVSEKSIEYEAEDLESSANRNKTWFPYSKGGEARKWYGCNDLVVFFPECGKKIKNFKDENGNEKSRFRAAKYYFKPAITWSLTSSSTQGFCARYREPGFVFDINGMSAFGQDLDFYLGLMNSWYSSDVLKTINPTMAFQIGDVGKIPSPGNINRARIEELAKKCREISKMDWDSYESSWHFELFLGSGELTKGRLVSLFNKARDKWDRLSVDINISQNEIDDEVINSLGVSHRNKSVESHDYLSRTSNLKCFHGSISAELISYFLGCVMGRYSLDKPGLILASQGETVRDYLAQIPEPSFTPDDNAIIPLTDQEWFPADATNRFRDFVCTVWGEEHLQENLDFVAESLCLHAIKPKKGEAALETIRRYLSTQFFKDHLRTYKKRPIYWLFSSGKQKAFECLVYLHRYNESTLAEMRTDYVIPLTTKLASYVEKLEQDKDASTSAAEAKAIEKELSKLYKQQAELNTFDEKLRHYADQRISLDLDDGVKVNYGKFGDLLAEVKQVVGK